MDIDNSFGMCPEAKICPYFTITARHWEISHSLRQCILENLLSKVGGNYGQGMAYRSHKIKLAIRHYSKLLGFYS